MRWKTRTRRTLVGSLLLLASLPARGRAQAAPPLRCGAGEDAGETRGLVLLPEGDLFCPLLADPKAEHSFASYLRGAFASAAENGGNTDIGSVGLGDRFALVRWGGSRPGSGLQLGVVGAIFAQFDVTTPSFDLINADYLVGIPATARVGGSSARLTLFHQSSHLGDEYLLHSEIERENLSFEALDLVLSQEAGPLRVYAGGQYLFRRQPGAVDPKVAHAGSELRIGPLRGPRLVAAVDLKSTQQQGWKPAWSARGGVEIAHWKRAEDPPRLVSVLAEYYHGPSPYGQFFREDIHYVGVGMHLTLH